MINSVLVTDIFEKIEKKTFITTNIVLMTGRLTVKLANHASHIGNILGNIDSSLLHFKFRSSVFLLLSFVACFALSN